MKNFSVTAACLIALVFFAGCAGETEAEINARRAESEALIAEGYARAAEAEAQKAAADSQAEMLSQVVDSVKSGAKTLADDVGDGKYDDHIDKIKKFREPTWRESMTEVGKEFAGGLGKGVGQSAGN